MSHNCRIVQIAETSLRCVCERLRRVGDGFATYAMTWRRFCDNFCRKKSITCLKLWRPVRDEFAMHARTLRYHANVSRQFRDRSRRFGESIRKPIANLSHPSEIGAKRYLRKAKYSRIALQGAQLKVEIQKPEDHWSCKRSPDILTLVKHKTYKTWKIYGKEITLTFNTHITS